LGRPPNRLGVTRDALRSFSLIARREFLTRVRSRVYLIVTAVLIVALAGFIILLAVVNNKSTTTVQVGFVGASQALAKPLAAYSGGGFTIQTQTVQSVRSGEDQVRSGSLDVLVSGEPTAPVVEYKAQLDPTVATDLTAVVQDLVFRQALAGSGVDPATIEAKVAAASFHGVALDANAAQRSQRMIIGIFVAALLYIALAGYGNIVASSIVEDKATRIVEILLSTVRPRQLLFGKVVGIGLVGLIQLVVLGAVALVAVLKTQVISVPAVGITAVLSGVLWFVLGFVFYALLYAAAASMVSRQQDVAAVVAPIGIFIIGSYVAFFWVVANPDNPIGAALSVLPPLAPVLMSARMATGDAQVWQVVLAVLFMLAAIAGMNALAARIYSNSVLRIGSRVRLAVAWKGRT
jgi:ABC-2 type transport system permease protein